MQKILTPLFYCAPIHAYVGYLQSDQIVIEACEHYQKGSYRNKCKIGTAQGSLLLSIPLKRGKHQQQNILDTEISNVENWQMNHIRSIKTAYGKAPYFEHYIDEFIETLNFGNTKLWETNMSLFKMINKWIQMDIPILVSEEYTAKDSIKNDIRFNKLIQYSLPPYPQVHELEQGFQSDLSIIDLIFHLGPESRNYLNNCSIIF